MKPFTKAVGVAAPIEGSNIDTDQIVPGRFLKRDRAEGYGPVLFHDMRFDGNGQEHADFVLNRAPFREATILIVDDNFGCGSSREAAAYALHDFGIRAVLAPSFGDIFYNNAMKNGIVPVRLPQATLAAARRAMGAGADPIVTVDLEALSVSLPDGVQAGFSIDPFWRECLLKGVDDLELTLSMAEDIARFESAYHADMPWVALSKDAVT